MFGKVKAMRADRGFGFIAPDVGGPDIFMHIHDVDDSLPFDESLRGKRVEFETEHSEKGLRAINVRAAE